MKRLLSLLAVVLATASLAIADDPKPKPTVVETSTAELVEAARGAKDRRRKSRTKVITNADVRKSRGKIVETTPGEIDVIAPAKTLAEEHREKLEATRAAEARLAAAETLVGDLAGQLAAIELSYYEESDLDRRDTVIVARFTETKKLLDEATRELEEARASLPRSEPPAADPAEPDPRSGSNG